MPAFNVDEFWKSMRRANTCKKIDDLFEKTLSGLSPAERDSACKELEKKYLNFDRLKNIVLTDGVAAAQEHVDYYSHTNPQDPHRFTQRQILVYTRAKVAELLGKDASPLAKAFAAATFGLTPREFGSDVVNRKPWLAVVDVLKNAPKQ